MGNKGQDDVEFLLTKAGAQYVYEYPLERLKPWAKGISRIDFLVLQGWHEEDKIYTLGLNPKVGLKEPGSKYEAGMPTACVLEVKTQSKSGTASQKVDYEIRRVAIAMREYNISKGRIVLDGAVYTDALIEYYNHTVIPDFRICDDLNIEVISREELSRRINAGTPL